MYAELNAKNLKLSLWETLNDVRKELIPNENANSVARQAREILRTVKTEMDIMNFTGNLSSELNKFVKE